MKRGFANNDKHQCDINYCFSSPWDNSTKFSGFPGVYR